MDKKNVADVLRSLATGIQNRPESARLRDVFDSIEAALSAGVSRAAVVEALRGQGFTMTLRTFDNAIYRIRKEKTKLQRADELLPVERFETNQHAFSLNTINLSAAEEKMSTHSTHNPDELTKIMSATVDLDALSKHAKRKK